LNHNAANETRSSSERQEIDPLFKEVLTFKFRQLDIPVQTQVEVSRLPRTMDALVILKWKKMLKKVQSHTPFAHFRRYNQVECKGKGDLLTIWGYHLILGRTHLYMGENKIAPSDMTVTIICSSKPRQVLYHSKEHVEFQQVGNGHYVNTDKVAVHIIVINELEINVTNYPLLVFASSKQKFRQFLRHALERNHLTYITFAYLVEPQITKEVLDMAGKYNLPREKLEFIKNDIGAELLPLFSKEDLLQYLSLEDRLHGLPPEERLRGLPPEERLHGLNAEERLRGLNTEERRRLKQLLEEMDNPQTRQD
jgi:hypothetical protein